MGEIMRTASWSTMDGAFTVSLYEETGSAKDRDSLTREVRVRHIYTRRGERVEKIGVKPVSLSEADAVSAALRYGNLHRVIGVFVDVLSAAGMHSHMGACLRSLAH